MTLRKLGKPFFALLFVVCSTPWAHAEVIVPPTSEWKYLHPTDGKDPKQSVPDFHKTFFNADFDDSSWKSGKDSAGESGGFAYGEEEFKGVDLGQPEKPEDRKTAYFRLKFKTTSPQKDVVLKCRRDDAILVYLDGKEVLRDNLPDGPDSYDMFAKSTINEEAKLETFPLKVELPAGDHLLAISVHNRAEGSSDLRLGEVSLETADAEATPAAADKK